MSHPSRQAMMENAILERRKVQKWLSQQMIDGMPKAFTKVQYRQLATSELGIFSKAAFDHAWISAIEDSGRHDWYDPIPRRRQSQQ
jgi:hypothetical protein